MGKPVMGGEARDSSEPVSGDSKQHRACAVWTVLEEGRYTWNVSGLWYKQGGESFLKPVREFRK